MLFEIVGWPIQYLIATWDGWKVGYTLIINAYIDSQINTQVHIYPHSLSYCHSGLKHIPISDLSLRFQHYAENVIPKLT